MLKAKVGNKEFTIETEGINHFNGKLNGNDFQLDVLNEGKGLYHVLRNNKGYKIQVLKTNLEEKTATLLVNGNRYDVSIEDRFDLLLKEMGMDNLQSSKVANLKAPMPGLVLDIAVAGGSQVKKGDPLLVLEAMKMENILKSPADLTVKSIEVEKGAAVEKNTVLINFE